MRVVVTGAAGNLGSRLCHVLAEAGHEVVATDRRQPAAELPIPLVEADLLDFAAVRPLMDGAEAVVHAGNYPTYRDPPGHVIFRDNVSINHDVFESARQAGARTIIFASSVQAIARYRPRHEQAGPCRLAYLPVDGDIPACPSNAYALSKQVGELMLAYYVRQYGMAGVAIRFPLLLGTKDVQSMRLRLGDPHPSHLEEGCGWLAFQDAALLVEAVLRAKLPDFRIYHPASPEPLSILTVPEILAKCYAHVPLKRPAAEIGSLVDISRITAETGWTPRVPLILPASRAPLPPSAPRECTGEMAKES